MAASVPLFTRTADTQTRTQFREEVTLSAADFQDALPGRDDLREHLLKPPMIHRCCHPPPSIHSVHTVPVLATRRAIPFRRRVRKGCRHIHRFLSRGCLSSRHDWLRPPRPHCSPAQTSQRPATPRFVARSDRSRHGDRPGGPSSRWVTGGVGSAASECYSISMLARSLNWCSQASVFSACERSVPTRLWTLEHRPVPPEAPQVAHIGREVGARQQDVPAAVGWTIRRDIRLAVPVEIPKHGLIAGKSPYVGVERG